MSSTQDIASLAMMLNHVVIELERATSRERLAAMLRECSITLETCMAARRDEERTSTQLTRGEVANLVAHLLETDGEREQLALLRRIRGWLAHVDQS